MLVSRKKWFFHGVEIETGKRIFFGLEIFRCAYRNVCEFLRTVLHARNKFFHIFKIQFTGMSELHK